MLGVIVDLSVLLAEGVRDVLKLDIRSVVENEGRTEVVVAEQEVDIAEGDAIGMAHVEAVAGQLAKHIKLGITVNLLGYLVELAHGEVAQTLVGSARLALESDEHPEALKDAVCSPGGSTIAGVHALESGAFRAAVMNAVNAAFDRTRKLGK